MLTNTTLYDELSEIDNDDDDDICICIYVYDDDICLCIYDEVCVCYEK